MSCGSAQDALISLPETFSSRNLRRNLSQMMNELAEQLQKSEEKVRNAVQTESLVITARNNEISHTEVTRQTSSFLTEPRVFGRDQECDQLMNLLTNEESTIVGKVPILAIVGSGGVGKTTIARIVFNDPKVVSYFEVRIWICVSTWFDVDRLTREMLEGACGNRYDELRNLNKLQSNLKDELVSKRFLFVLDDMWEDDDKSQWDSMVAPLHNCAVKGSIILVTTRKQSVAKLVDARDTIYLKGLDDNAFSSFFSTCIFNDPNYGGNWRLRNIGQQIANKLKGNPLAAKTVTALLKEKVDERYWMKIRDSEEWKSQSGPNDIMPALRLSYDHMPFHLQRCFSYCAIFPEDHAFTCEELVYLWMAQGFLDVRSEGKRMEDIGSAYFYDLFDRGFFQTKQSTYGGLAYDHGFFQTKQSTYSGLVYYTFHDLINDLACMVASKQCLTINGPETRQIPATIRHLSIYNCRRSGEEEIVRALACLEGQNLRTIFSWDELPSGTSGSISDLLKITKFLRAMRLNLCFLVQPHNVNFQKFVSLRYLRLIISNNNTCMTLPREICMLYHLEVFEIKIEHGWFPILELPSNFSDLVSLRHFIVEGEIDMHSKIKDVGKLTSLQELNQFDVQQKKGFEIEQLGSLKEIGGSLQISNLENVKSKIEASKARLAEKKKLDALYLQWNYGEQENENVLEGLKPNTNLKSLGIEGYGGVASPTWLEPSLIFLESLFLVDCKAWELLPPIGELEFLKHLKLSGLPLREIGPQCYGTRQSMKFPSLEELSIIDMPNLEKWVWNDQLQLSLCFKKLKKLKIRGCTKLMDLPLLGCATSELLERFPSLESLKIEDCPPLGFHEFSFLRVLEISYISGLESLDLHSFVALENLVIEGCQSLTSLTFGAHLVCLRILEIVSCKTLSSIKDLKSWVNLEGLRFCDCPGFVAAWDSASKEIERTEPDFSLSLKEVNGDSLALLTLPICKQLTSLQILYLEVYTTEEYELSLQLLTSIDLVDIRGCKNLQSFPFYFFPSLKTITIKFPRIQSLPINSRVDIIEGCLKLRRIKEVHVLIFPVQITFELN
ncbi:disease resistance protein RGA4 [Carex littledalei]|uniref:Disease resistance protein RGA4 n=1 Tax=Carex littledalei TaxID=544730 RepID=A0A833RGJ3_9POAL|nr:disease resistance protein RGA4 [Carex littledalei]